MDTSVCVGVPWSAGLLARLAGPRHTVVLEHLTQPSPARRRVLAGLAGYHLNLIHLNFIQTIFIINAKYIQYCVNVGE